MTVFYSIVFTSAVCLFYPLQAQFPDIIENEYYKYAYPNSIDPKFAFFKDKESIINFLNSKRDRSPLLVESIFKAYNDCFVEDVKPVPSGRRKPFIVIECGHLKHRQLITAYIGETMGGQYLQTPPVCMSSLVPHLNRGTLIKSAYYQLSLYAVEAEVKRCLAKGITAIVNSYWYGQAAFIIGKLFRRTADLPPADADVFQPPKDLMRPDVVIHLNQSIIKSKLEMEYYNSKVSNRFGLKYMNKYCDIYEKFANPNVTTVQLDANTDKCIIEIHNQFDKLKNDSLDFTLATPLIRDRTTHFVLHDIIIFKNVDEVWDIFEAERQYQPRLVEGLKEAYFSCIPKNVTAYANKTVPFVVVEGSVRRSKRLIGKLFAKAIGGQFVNVPPFCLNSFSTAFMPGTKAKFAFYYLSYYITAHIVKQLQWEGKVAVLNGYWSEQVAFFINRNVLNMIDIPEEGNVIYKYPEDLKKPDLLFYVSPPYSTNSTRKMKAWYERANIIYQRLEIPRQIAVDSGPGFLNASLTMVEHFKEIFPHVEITPSL